MADRFGDDITLELDGHVAVVTFERPPLNHVSVDLIRELANALEAVDSAAKARAVVLQSNGKVFCAGADLASSPSGSGLTMTSVNSLYDEAVRLFACQTPVVAAIQGAAVGAGLGLAVAADFRVASPEARFAANFVKLGFHPGFALTHTLPRLLGEQRAALMCLTGRRVKAEEALAWGLVDEVVPADQLRAAALNLAREIAENAPLALRATRKTLRAGLAEAVRATTDHEHAEQSALRKTEDYAEGVRSVAERRPGNFVGR